MKYIILFSLLFVFSCKNTETNTKSDISLSKNIKSIELVVDGMTCAGCESTIQSNVATLEGISSVVASHTEGNTVVVFDNTLADTTIIKQKINESGYSVVSISLSN